MEGIIQFLRDTLDGPLYIVTVIICVILIFACIGYLAERKIKEKKEKDQYASVQGNGGNVPLQEVGVSTAPVASANAPQQTTISKEATTIMEPIIENVSSPSVAEGKTVQQEMSPQTTLSPIQEVSSPATSNQGISPSTTVAKQNTVQQGSTIPPMPSGVSEQVAQESPSNVAGAEPVTPVVPSQAVSVPQQNLASAIPEIVTAPTPITSQAVQPVQKQASPAVNVGEISQNSTPSQSPLPVSTNYETVVAVPVVKVPSAQELK